MPVSPAARRSPGSSWRDPRLVVGVLIVAVCVLAGGRLLASADDAVAVWAVGADLTSGSPVAPRDLVRREVRFVDAADADRYLSADVALPAGAMLERAVGAGELLPRAALGTERSGPVLEVPLSVAFDAVPRTVRTGSVVDIWVTPDEVSGGPTGKSILVFDDVVVVDAPPSGSSLAPTGSRQIIIGVDGAQEGFLPTALADVANGTAVVTRRG